MTTEEFRKQIDDRTDDLISQIHRHNITIGNLVKSAYERGYADGRALSNEPSDTGYITTFGVLKVGNKFKVFDDTTTFIKTTSDNKYLAYDTETSKCIFLQDDFPVILIKVGDEE